MTDTTVEAPATPRLKQQYKDVIIPEMEKEFKYSNPMQVARVQKVVVSMGVGAAARDSKLIEGAVKDLTLITGQKPKITKAKKSVAGNYNFGLTEQSMFHEIDPDSIDHQRGMDITVVTSTKDDKEASALLKHLGFPFKEN